MRYVKFTDRARDWLREHRTLFTQVAAVAGIAAIVGAIMIPGIAVTKGRHAAAVSSINQRISQAVSGLAGLTEDVDDLYGMAEAIGENRDSIDDLQLRAGEAEWRLAELEDGTNSPAPYSLKVWLTGTFGSYVLHAKSSEAGNFSASVWLYYDEPVALNATTYSEAMGEFYAGLDTTAATFKPYVPALSYNGTTWGVTAITFNIGTFTLEAEAEKAVAVVFGGLSDDYTPGWAYADAWPALKD